jgi:hypothetical protein
MTHLAGWVDASPSCPSASTEVWGAGSGSRRCDHDRDALLLRYAVSYRDVEELLTERASKLIT